MIDIGEKMRQNQTFFACGKLKSKCLLSIFVQCNVKKSSRRPPRVHRLLCNEFPKGFSGNSRVFKTNSLFNLFNEVSGSVFMATYFCSVNTNCCCLTGESRTGSGNSDGGSTAAAEDVGVVSSSEHGTGLFSSSTALVCSCSSCSSSSSSSMTITSGCSCGRGDPRSSMIASRRRRFWRCSPTCDDSVRFCIEEKSYSLLTLQFFDVLIDVSRESKKATPFREFRQSAPFSSYSRTFSSKPSSSR